MKISKAKIDKIKEDILSVLYTNSPKMLFTVEIAHEIARDEEFTKRLLGDMEKDDLVVAVKKNPDGKDYTLRKRWRLSSTAYEAYKTIEDKKVIYDDIENTYF